MSDYFHINLYRYSLYKALMLDLVLFLTSNYSLSVRVKLYLVLQSIRLCKWLKQLDSKLSPVKGFMGSNPLSMKFMA